MSSPPLSPRSSAAMARHSAVRSSTPVGTTGVVGASQSSSLHGFGGGILTFAPKGGYQAARRVTESTQLFTLVANLGDSKSLITHPAGTTHSQMTEDELIQAGISDDLIRLSIGLESIEDLKADLQSALDQSCSDK